MNLEEKTDSVRRYGGGSSVEVEDVFREYDYPTQPESGSESVKTAGRSFWYIPEGSRQIPSAGVADTGTAVSDALTWELFDDLSTSQPSDVDAVAKCYRQTPFDEVRREIWSYADLPNDWDAYGAEQIPLASIGNAEKLLEQIERQGLPVPRCMPFPTGEIGFYWRRPEGYAEICIDSKSELFCFVDSDDPNWDNDGEMGSLGDGVPASLLGFLK